MAEIRKSKRQSIFNKFDYHCAYCGGFLTATSETLDHFIPISKGGNNEFDNLLPACRWCNVEKTNLDIEEFRLIVEKRKNKKFKFYYERIQENGRN